MKREPSRILIAFEIRSLARTCGDQSGVVRILALMRMRIGGLVRRNVHDVDLNASPVRIVGQPEPRQDRTSCLPADLAPVHRRRIIDHKGDERAIAIPGGARLERSRWTRAANWVEAARSIGRSDLRVRAYLAHAIIADVDTQDLSRAVGLAALPARLGYYADCCSDS
jgi:hypothetical protein